MKYQKKAREAKPVTLVNPLNSEMWLCDDYNTTKDIDGVSYLSVYKPDNRHRVFLMRKDALKRLKNA